MNPMLSTVLDWLKAQKQRSLKMLLAEHASNAKKVNWSYMQSTEFHDSLGSLALDAQHPKCKTEDLLLFVVPKVHHVTMLNWMPLKCRSSRA